MASVRLASGRPLTVIEGGGASVRQMGQSCLIVGLSSTAGSSSKTKGPRKLS
jgi:hypothetical protein